MVWNWQIGLFFSCYVSEDSLNSDTEKIIYSSLPLEYHMINFEMLGLPIKAEKWQTTLPFIVKVNKVSIHSEMDQPIYSFP